MAMLRRVVTELGPRRALVVLLAVGWAVIIGAGSAAAPESTEWLGIPALSSIFLILFGISAVFSITVVVVVLLSGTAGEQERPPRKPLWPTIVLLLVFLLIATQADPSGLQDPNEQPEAVEPDGQAEGGASVIRSALPTGRELAALLLVAATAIGLIVWTRRRYNSLTAERELESHDTDTSLAAMMTRAVDRLELETDPRSSVLLAYAELEDGLAAEGLAREPTETPTEHVRRALLAVTVDHRAVEELSALYERARFSLQTITAEDQRDAGSALQRIRAGLGVHR